MQGCRSRLKEAENMSSPIPDDQRTSALSVSSVPYVDQSFIPSIAGFTGERAGYEFREGRHGIGYYQREDDYGDAIVEKGDALGMHSCVGCLRTGADVHMQKALIFTAERHKFYYTHRQPSLDPRIAAIETSEQLRQVCAVKACLSE
jgi:hypothetical protein